MAECTFRYIEKHEVNRVFTLNFDTSDQVLWTKMLTLAKELGLKEDFPDEAPSNPKTWHQLLQNIPEDELGDVEEDWWMMLKGGFDVAYETLNAEGEVLFED